jgi:hypothetical protein
VKDVIELETKFQLAVDLVQEIDLRFEELQLGDHSIFRQVQACVSCKRRNRSAVDASVTPQHALHHQQYLCFLLRLRMVVYLIRFCKPATVPRWFECSASDVRLAELAAKATHRIRTDDLLITESFKHQTFPLDIPDSRQCSPVVWSHRCPLGYQTLKVGLILRLSSSVPPIIERISGYLSRVIDIADPQTGQK